MDVLRHNENYTDINEKLYYNERLYGHAQAHRLVDLAITDIRNEQFNASVSSPQVRTIY